MTDEPSTPLAHHEPAAAHHGAEDGHVDEHMSDERGHGEPRLGPVDWSGWGYALIGVLAGLLVVGAFWVSLG